MKTPAKFIGVAVTTLFLAGCDGAAPETESDRFLDYLNAVHERDIEKSPMLAADFDRDVGRDRWDDISSEADRAYADQLRTDIDHVNASFDIDELGSRARLQYRVFVDERVLKLDRYEWRNHLYMLNQIVGLHLLVPGTLANSHPISEAADAEDYIARIEKVLPLFQQLMDRMREQEDVGVMMPKPVYPRLIEGAQQIVSGRPFDQDSETDSLVWADFKRKVDGLETGEGEKTALLDDAKAALTGPFKTAYDDLISFLEDQQDRTEVTGGVWQLPDGDDFYAFLIRQFTTTTMRPDEIHELGLREVDRIQGEMQAIMDRVGFDGDLDEFMASIKEDPQFTFDNTDEGRAAYLDLAQSIVDGMMARLDESFYDKPEIPFEIRRFEAYREASAPGGFYEAGSADGSKPGRIYLNLADMSQNLTFDLEALLYHEGVPGHHYQISTILTDDSIPELRKANPWWLNSAFVEGWALYAERLAKDMGFYEDPYSDFGRLAAELWRACRLVVDSGLHYKRWSREEAIAYLNENTPSTEAANARAVDRYLAVPGQATSFMVGMLTILDLREKARATLGENFDIRAFHSTALKNGYIPLWALEESVNEQIAEETIQ